MLGLQLLPTNGFSIKPLRVKLLAGEQKATEGEHPESSARCSDQWSTFGCGCRKAQTWRFCRGELSQAPDGEAPRCLVPHFLRSSLGTKANRPFNLVVSLMSISGHGSKRLTCYFQVVLASEWTLYFLEKTNPGAGVAEELRTSILRGFSL